MPKLNSNSSKGFGCVFYLAFMQRTANGLILGLSLLFVYQGYAQTEPGQIEPFLYEQEELEQREQIDLIDDSELNKEQSQEGEVSGQEEIRITISAMGLNYLPSSHSLDNDSVVTLETLIRLAVSQSNGNFSFPELNQLAGELSSSLRSKGYVLANVYLPAQSVENETIVFQVVPGVLANVDAVSSQLYVADQLESIFDTRLDEAVNSKQLERQLLHINDLPGVTVNGVFAPAERAGFTQMRLNFSEQDKLAFRLRVDNYNTESTGDLRLLAGTSVRNITGNRDNLDVDIVQTFDSGDLTSARLHYQIFSPNLRHRFGGNYRESDYETKSASSNVEGENSIGEIYWRAAWARSSSFNLSTRLSLAHKRAEQTQISDFGKDKLTVIGIGLNSDGVDSRLNGLQGISINYYKGLNSSMGSLDSTGSTDSIRDNITGEFEKWLITLQRIQSLGNSNRLRLRMAGQFTNDRLSSLEQVNLGGPYSVRAFALGVASGDRSKFASLEWITDWFPFANQNAFGEADWRDVLDLSLFVDWGKVAQVSSGGQEGAGAGLALKATDPDDRWKAELSAAFPFQDKDQNGIEFDDEQVWFSLSAFF